MKFRSVILSLCVVCIGLQSQDPNAVLNEHKPLVEKLIVVARTQQEIMDKLLNNKNTSVEQLRELSLDEIKMVEGALHKELEVLENLFDEAIPGSTLHAELKTKYLPLTLELKRKLTSVSIEYEKKVHTGVQYPSRMSISLGVGSSVGVAAYLLGMYYTESKIGLLSALKYALIAGTVTALVLYREEVVGGTKKIVDVCVTQGRKALTALQRMSTGTKIAAVTASGVLVAAPFALRSLPKMLGFGGTKKQDLSSFYQKSGTKGGCFGFNQLNDPNN